MTSRTGLSLVDIQNVLDMTFQHVERPEVKKKKFENKGRYGGTSEHIHTRHGLIMAVVAFAACVVDNLTGIYNAFFFTWQWWVLYFAIFWGFYAYMKPTLKWNFFGSVTEDTLNWHNIIIAWLFASVIVHLPRFNELGLHIKADAGVFLTILLTSYCTMLFLRGLHSYFTGLGLLPRIMQHRQSPSGTMAMIMNSFSIAVGCCLFFSVCGHMQDVVGTPLKHAVCVRMLGPVGTPSDYPHFSWFFLDRPGSASSYLYDLLLSPPENTTPSGNTTLPASAASDAPVEGKSDVIPPLLSLWITLVAMSIANSVAESAAHTEAAAEAPAEGKRLSRASSDESGASGRAPRHLQRGASDTGAGRVEGGRGKAGGSGSKPEFLPMVPWYSGTTADVLKTGMQIFVQAKIFLGRFDMRSLQQVSATAEQARGEEADGFTFEHFAERPELWWDFMADTGDGGDSTYTVARMLAQPELVLPVTIEAAPGHPATRPPPLHTTDTSDHPEEATDEELHTSDADKTSPRQVRPKPKAESCGGLGAAEPGLAADHEGWPEGGRDRREGRASFSAAAEGLSTARGARRGAGVKGRRARRSARGLLRSLRSAVWRRCSRTDTPRVALPRADLLIIGGDLAYPDPTPDTYDQRLFRPFEYALPPPPQAPDRARVAVHKPRDILPEGCPGLAQYSGPQAFCIPGNHDWFDGLDTFLKHICCRGWLGGWMMPQHHSYFALHLPHGWWLFCLDLGIDEDIDMHQLKYFSRVAELRVGPTDAVVIVTHEPLWLQNFMFGREDAFKTKHVYNLITYYLQDRARLWVCGDIHNYIRNSAERPQVARPGDRRPPGGSPREHAEGRGGAVFTARAAPAPYPEHLIVCGGGGAFLHPTHVFRDFRDFLGFQYRCRSAFPTFQTSRMIGACLLPLFREHNWTFDVIGGLVYFLLSSSAHPVCGISARMAPPPEASSSWERLWNYATRLVAVFASAYADVVVKIMSQSYLTLTTLVVGALGAYALVGDTARLKPGYRGLCAAVHMTAHFTAAIVLMLLLELGLDLCVQHQVLGRDGVGGLWAQLASDTATEDPHTLNGRLEQWTFGLYRLVLRQLFVVFDLPELMASTRERICRSGWGGISRHDTVLYYGSMFVYYWVLCTPVVSWILGVYLYVMVNWFCVNFDEAFSALRIPHYKSFLRFHVKKDGALEMFAIGIRKVPRKWVRTSGARGSPSAWEAAPGEPGSAQEQSADCAASPLHGVLGSGEVIDHIVIEKQYHADTSHEGMDI